MIKQNENEYLIKTNGFLSGIKRFFQPNYISDKQNFSHLRSEINDLQRKIRWQEQYIKENKLNMQKLAATDVRIAYHVAQLGSDLISWKDRVNKLEKLVQ